MRVAINPNITLGFVHIGYLVIDSVVCTSTELYIIVLVTKSQTSDRLFSMSNIMKQIIPSVPSVHECLSELSLCTPLKPVKRLNSFEDCPADTTTTVNSACSLGDEEDISSCGSIKIRRLGRTSRHESELSVSSLSSDGSTKQPPEAPRLFSLNRGNRRKGSRRYNSENGNFFPKTTPRMVKGLYFPSYERTAVAAVRSDCRFAFDSSKSDEPPRKPQRQRSIRVMNRPSSPTTTISEKVDAIPRLPRRERSEHEFQLVICD